MNFNQANIICKKHFGKPKEFGYMYLQPYAEYSKDIKYPVVFKITLHQKNKLNISLVEYSYNKMYFTLLNCDYTYYNEKFFEKIIKKYKKLFKILKEIEKEKINE